uniref:Ig-like domain-containing protein n=1 Tax=Anas zonorhyncha TaxID=75864 RepID=A0A8B9ZYP8_9AVES
LPSPSPLLVFAGLQAQTREELSQHEGSDLSVLCPYPAKVDHREMKKAWCRAVGQTGRCELVVITDTAYLWGTNSGQNGRAWIQDDTQKRSVTITMEKLQAQDSGVYWCALYTPNATINFTRIMEVRLSVAKREYLLTDFGLVSPASSWELPSVLTHYHVAMNPPGHSRFLHSLPFLITMLCEERLLSNSCSMEGDELEYVLGRGGHFWKCIGNPTSMEILRRIIE